jgi:hypothetical protein
VGIAGNKCQVSVNVSLGLVEVLSVIKTGRCKVCIENTEIVLQCNRI